MVNEIKDKNNKGELKAQLSHLACSYYSSFQPNKSSLKKHGILKKLRSRKDIVILKPDKGNGVVILDRSFYDESMLKIVSDTRKFKRLDTDLTLKRERQLQRLLRKLKTNNCICSNIYDKIYPSGSRPARMYGLPKVHKCKNEYDMPPFRPIVSSIGSYNYNLAKFLSDLISPHICSDYCTKDTFTFVEEINKVSTVDKYFVSYDVVSPFPNIPLEEIIEIALDQIYLYNREIKIKRSDLKRLFLFATSETHFLLNGSFYDQVDGVAMGSPLAPILANLFLGHHEGKWLSEYNGEPPIFYKRYVDDIIALFNNELEADNFLTYINIKASQYKIYFRKEV